MTDALILIPTHDHAAYLPFAVRSALGQRGASIEVVVVGDGVGDDTREAIRPFLADPRVRFLDLPKGERLGERHRHAVLLETSAPVIAYLADDDVLAWDHMVSLLALLEDADFAHAPRVEVRPPDDLVFVPMDFGRPRYLEHHALAIWNPIGLTGVAHTLAAYRRLPHGWRTTPAGTPTDYYMWRQFIEQPWFRGRTGRQLTALIFPDPLWKGRPVAERVACLERYLAALGGDGLEQWRREHVVEVWRKAALDREEAWMGLQLQTRAITRTRTWRAREAIVRRLPAWLLRSSRGGAR